MVSTKTVIGLDLSLTGTGIVALSYPDGSVVTTKQITSNKKDIARLNHLQYQIIIEIIGNLPRLVVIEGYALAFARGSRLADLAELGGIVKCELYAAEYDFIVVPPTRLKKFVTGKGNAKKDQMRLETYKRWGFEHESNDVVDAYGLAQLGLAVIGKGGKLTKFQQEVVRDIVKTMEKEVS